MERNTIIKLFSALLLLVLSGCDPAYRLLVVNETAEAVEVVVYFTDSEYTDWYREQLKPFQTTSRGKEYTYSFPPGSHQIGTGNLAIPLEEQIPFSKLLVIAGTDTLHYDNLSSFVEELEGSAGNNVIYRVRSADPRE